jgi:hypothetical protein
VAVRPSGDWPSAAARSPTASAAWRQVSIMSSSCRCSERKLGPMRFRRACR